jgi:hypothetical protein
VGTKKRKPPLSLKIYLSDKEGQFETLSIAIKKIIYLYIHACICINIRVSAEEISSFNHSLHWIASSSETKTGLPFRMESLKASISLLHVAELNLDVHRATSTLSCFASYLPLSSDISTSSFPPSTWLIVPSATSAPCPVNLNDGIFAAASEC